MYQTPSEERYDKAKSLLRMMRKMSNTFGQDAIAIETEFYLQDEEQAANLAIQLHKENARVEAMEFNPDKSKWTVRSVAESLNLHNRDTLNWLERMLEIAENYNCTLKSSSPDFDIQLF